MIPAYGGALGDSSEYAGAIEPASVASRRRCKMGLKGFPGPFLTSQSTFKKAQDLEIMQTLSTANL